MFHFGSGKKDKPSPSDCLPNENIEGYIWQNKIVCRLAADTNKEYDEFYIHTDFAKVYEYYILKSAANI